jgi:hypothetical protein
MKKLLLCIFLFAAAELHSQEWKPVYLPDPIMGSVAGEAQGKIYLGGFSPCFSSSDGTHFQPSGPEPAPYISWCSSVVSAGPYTIGAFSGGIYRSADGGMTWSLASSAAMTRKLLNVNDTLYAAGYKLYRSLDQGQTWHVLWGASWSIGPSYHSMYNIIQHNNRLYINFENKLFSIKTNGTDSIHHVNDLGKSMASFGNTLYAMINNDFCVSVDNGNSWSIKHNGLYFGCYPIRFTLKDSTIYLGTSDGLFTSSASSIYWNYMPGLQGACTSVYLNDNSMFVNNVVRLMRSDDNGLSWTAVYKGIYSTSSYPRFVVGNPYFNVAAGIESDFRNVSADGFEELQDAVPYMYSNYVNVYNKIFTSSSYTSDGLNWQTFTYGGPEYGTESMIGHQGKYFMNIVSGTDHLVSADTSDLESWSPVTVPVNHTVVRLGGDQTIIAALSIDYTANDTFLLTSSDLGNTWNIKAAPLLGQIVVSQGQIIVYDHQRAVATFDGGDTWSDQFAGLDTSRFANIVVHQDTMYAVAVDIDPAWPHPQTWGVYRYSTDSSKWCPINYNIHTLMPDQYSGGINVALSSDNKNLFLSKGDYGLWQLSNYFPVDVAEASEEAGRLKVFPNPSAGPFSIQLPEQMDLDKAELVVYDILGKVIMRTKITGHSTSFDLRHVPKGIYFAELRTATEKLNSKIAVK